MQDNVGRCDTRDPMLNEFCVNEQAEPPSYSCTCTHPYFFGEQNRLAMIGRVLSKGAANNFFIDLHQEETNE